MTDHTARLAEFRDRIDSLDGILLHTLGERFRITNQVGHLKAEAGLPAFDPDREAAQRARFHEIAREVGLPSELVEQLMAMIIDQVKLNHEKIRGEL
ncbi:chorismate mutase [Palleronia caenipelagi]|uniref:chorismate mutase n=1 Tax=Palleronia caenipelagi TaxID=2489174 RepID=A0A547PR48_9RHOB|nr:chorismate mutase [Palleronia caenipelagi]TRD16616.1 chorismate mutase [Palleronia caenipelagi]